MTEITGSAWACPLTTLSNHSCNLGRSSHYTNEVETSETVVGQFSLLTDSDMFLMMHLEPVAEGWAAPVASHSFQFSLFKEKPVR